MRICFIGDIMLSENQLKNGYENKKSDPLRWYDCVKDYINSNDVIIGNFETTISNGVEKSGFPKFNSPVKFLRDIKSNINFNILSLCNNHCCDCGEKGLINTINEIEKNGITCIGAYRNNEEFENNYPIILNVDGIRIGLLNYCESINNNTELKDAVVNRLNDDIIIDVLKIRNSVDYIICLLHCGEEYSSEPSYEIQSKLHSLIELGIDHIVCSHTHVPQKIENYSYDGKNHYIVYSLGNFISDQRRLFVDTGMIVVFEINENGVNIEEHKTWISCPDFNDIDSYKVLFVEDELNSKHHIFNEKELYKLNCVKAYDKIV